MSNKRSEKHSSLADVLAQISDVKVRSMHTPISQELPDESKAKLRSNSADREYKRLDLSFMRETHEQGPLIVPSFALIERGRPYTRLAVEATWDVWPFSRTTYRRHITSRTFFFEKAIDDGVLSSLKRTALERLKFFMESAILEISIRFSGALTEELDVKLNGLDFDEIYIVGEAPKWNVFPDNDSTESTADGLHLLIGRIDETYWLIDSFDSRR